MAATIQEHRRKTWQKTVNGPYQVTFDGVQQRADFSALEYRNRVLNPNWKVLVSRGLDATNAYTRAGFDYIRPLKLYIEDVNVNTGTTSGSWIVGTAGTSVHEPATDPVTRDIALARVKSKIASSANTAKAAIPLAEAHELQGLVGQMADLSYKFTFAFEKLKRGKKASFLGHTWKVVSKRSRRKACSEAWLAYSFGIAPMVGDVQNLSETIAEALLKDYGFEHLTGTCTSRYTQTSVSTTTGTVNQNVDFIRRTTNKVSYRYIAAIDFSVKSNLDYGLLKRLGFSFEELPSIGWELTPYSWMLDYFTTVGHYLDDTFVIPAGATKYLSLNERLSTLAVIDAKPNPGSQNVKTIGLDVQLGGYKRFVFSRTKLSQLPHAALRFRTVNEISQNSVNRLLNLLSLIGSKH